MEPFLLSTGLVALAEIGDKTQLLAIVLAATWRRPWPILAGILAATLLNHGLAGAAGAWTAGILDGPWVRYVLGAAFLAFAVWALVPDSLDSRPDPERRVGALAIFQATAIAFFLVEMGDKTQVATVALGARYQDVVVVALGTTLGMMLANAPAVFLGEAATRIAPIAWIRRAAATAFAATGLWMIFGG